MLISYFKNCLPLLLVINLSPKKFKSLSAPGFQPVSYDSEGPVKGGDPELSVSTPTLLSYPNNPNPDKKQVFKKLFNEVEKIKRSGDLKELFKIYSLLGSRYYENNDYVSSLRYYGMALEQFKGNPSDTNYVEVLVRTGVINSEMRNHEIAYTIFKKAITILEHMEGENHALSYKYYLNMASEYYRLDKIPEAESYYRTHLKHSILFNDSIQIGKALFGLSRIELQKNNLTEALRLAKQSFSILSSNKADKKTRMVCALNFSHIYIHLKQYDNALIEAEKAFTQAREANDLKILSEAAFHLKTIYYEKKDYESAFNYQEFYSLLKDSLFNLNKKLELFTQSVNYEFEQKSKQDSLHHSSVRQKLENELQIKEVKQRSNNIIFFAVGFGVVAVMMFYFYAHKQNRQKQQIEYEKRLSEAKITTLIAQINPHFVFNSLNSILSFIQSSNKEEAIKYLSKFSKIVRLILEGSNQQTVTVNDEMQLLRLYVELEQLRNDHQFDFTIEVGEEIDRFNTEIPVMMLQPFIENAILHGIQNKISLSKEIKVDYRGLLNISYEQKGSKIVCSIKDNGVGRKKSRELMHESMFRYRSMGPEFVEKRLELLTGSACCIKYNDIYHELTNEPVGTEVVIELPIMN
ncbi:MAG: hypothetical protein K0S32_204 [Bacteroidetes bacterium]|jgi:tetratricopeptide (TPR) repeat protein|nr:hypothetical protein [Bacteroidota bacterium]